MPAGTRRDELLRDPVHLVLPAGHPAARRHREAVPLAELAGAVWAAGHVGMAWEQMTHRTCRQLGAFEPDVRHRTNDATIALALVARGMAVTMLPDLVLPGRHPGVVLRAIAEGGVSRGIFAATRTADAARPSTQALLAALLVAAAALPRHLRRSRRARCRCRRGRSRRAVRRGRAPAGGL
jgi:DNA-binding transcriptional LysR family regulator